MKKKTKSKMKVKKKGSKGIQGVARKTKSLLDDQLAQFSPALKEKLQEMRKQWGVEDLRLLGLKVLERALDLSEAFPVKQAQRNNEKKIQSRKKR